MSIEYYYSIPPVRVMVDIPQAFALTAAITASRITLGICPFYP